MGPRHGIKWEPDTESNWKRTCNEMGNQYMESKALLKSI